MVVYVVLMVKKITIGWYGGALFSNNPFFKHLWTRFEAIYLWGGFNLETRARAML